MNGGPMSPICMISIRSCKNGASAESLLRSGSGQCPKELRTDPRTGTPHSTATIAQCSVGRAARMEQGEIADV
jgi:hypothetical protein